MNKNKQRGPKKLDVGEPPKPKKKNKKSKKSKKK
jgi:hypothetical protein